MEREGEFEMREMRETREMRKMRAASCCCLKWSATRAMRAMRAGRGMWAGRGMSVAGATVAEDNNDHTNNNNNKVLVPTATTTIIITTANSNSNSSNYNMIKPATCWHAGQLAILLEVMARQLEGPSPALGNKQQAHCFWNASSLKCWKH